MVLFSIILHDTGVEAVWSLILYVLPFSFLAILFTKVLVVLTFASNKCFELVDTGQLVLHENCRR
jgi:hypothetical protein